MAESAVLYVKSKKIEQIAWSTPVRDHWCTSGYTATKSDFVLEEEDKKAVEVLEKTGQQYKVVDLGLASAATRIKAKIEGVNKTPTLICKGQKLKGLQQIMKMLEATANMQQK